MSPMRDFKCKRCAVQKERFYFTSQLGSFACEECGGILHMLPLSACSRDDRSSPVFPFTVNHIDARGRPMEIKSMAHLRRVEHQYGVVLTAFTSDPGARQMDPACVDLPRYRGEGIYRGIRE